jgi:hypothetical protein
MSASLALTIRRKCRFFRRRLPERRIAAAALIEIINGADIMV